MTLYLDCEFNGHGGQLISMALVSDVDGTNFYQVSREVLEKPIEPWIAANVTPKLGKEGVPYKTFRALLCLYLNQHLGEPIIADWPHDFVLLMNVMQGDSYEQSFMVPCTMRLIQSGSFTPDNPHNALSDAVALMNWCKENLK